MEESICEIDMSEMHPYDMLLIFSCLGRDLDFVWERLSNGSRQLYTMERENLGFIGENVKWLWWDSLEIQTANFQPTSPEFQILTTEYSQLEIYKGLI